MKHLDRHLVPPPKTNSGSIERPLAGQSQAEREFSPNGEVDVLGDEHPAMVTLRTEAPQHGITTGVETPDGERRWLSINSYPVRRPSDGAVDQVVAVFRIVEMSAATMEKSARRVAE